MAGEDKGAPVMLVTAVVGLTKAAAMEYADQGIRINAMPRA